MDQRLQHIPFYDALTPEEALAFQQSWAENPAADAHWKAWLRFQAEIQSDLKQHLPDRALLLLYALDQEMPDVLSEAERTRLESARPVLEEAMRVLPSLSVLIDQMRRQALDFDAVWAEETLAVPEKNVAKIIPIQSAAPLRSWMRYSAWAAVVVFLGIAGFWWISRTPDTPEGWTRFATATGETKTVTLPDGTQVRLFDQSEIMWPKNFVQRRATFSGRGLFDVQHDPAHPFQIETQQAVTEVLGTQFSITTQPERTDVVLIQGKVQLKNKTLAQKTVVLAPGEFSQVLNGRAASPPLSVDIPKTLAWTHQFFFVKTRLRAAVQQLNEAYGANIRLEDGLGDEEVYGTFEQSESLPSILNRLAQILPNVRVEEKQALQFVLRKTKG